MTPASRVLDRADRREMIEIPTPEGVPLRFSIARAGDRAAAFLVDLFCVLLVPVVLGLLMCLAGGRDQLLRAFMTLLVFVIRNFYFAFFETRWKGATPGKRRIGIRVIDRQGGPLRADAVLGRNLTRELEFFIPLTLLAVPEHVWPDHPGWLRLLAVLWAVGLALLPLFNRHRLRVGDLVGGTLVVSAPQAVLLPDLSSRIRKGSRAPDATYTFTRDQLDVYGIFELQVLEDVLRKQNKPGGAEALRTVCDRIKRKIRWDRSRWDVDPRVFLENFYAAQRAHLEHKMLLGRRQDRKRTTRRRRHGPR